MKTKILNYLLLICFVVTMMVPLTGIIVHKMASLFFLLLCIVHTIVYRKKMNGKRWGVLLTVVVAFMSGIFGMIYSEIPMVMAVHKVVSIALVFFLAIHIFVFHRKMLSQKRK